jgi:hypothetical protein
LNRGARIGAICTINRSTSKAGSTFSGAYFVPHKTCLTIGQLPMHLMGERVLRPALSRSAHKGARAVSVSRRESKRTDACFARGRARPLRYETRHNFTGSTACQTRALRIGKSGRPRCTSRRGQYALVVRPADFLRPIIGVSQIPRMRDEVMAHVRPTLVPIGSGNCSP